MVSTIPVDNSSVSSTWLTLLTTPSSEEGVFVVPRVTAVAAPTQRLSHALGGPADPLRLMSVASPLTVPLAKSSDHGRVGNTTPCPQGAKGKEVMEIDRNDLGHLSHGLELDDIDDDLPHSTIVRDDHDLLSEGDGNQGMKKNLTYSPAIELVPEPKKAWNRSNKGQSGTNTSTRKESAANTFAYSRPCPLP